NEPARFAKLAPSIMSRSRRLLRRQSRRIRSPSMPLVSHRPADADPTWTQLSCHPCRFLPPGWRSASWHRSLLRSDRIPIDQVVDCAQGHALAINHDFMSFRGGFGSCVEISANRDRNLYLLPDRLSKARSASSWETDIFGIKRSVART